MKFNVWNWLRRVGRPVRRNLALDVPWVGFPTEVRDRQPYDREAVVEQALEAWRLNPLARRIVGLTSQYVVGGGIRFRCGHAATARMIKTWWEHPLNQGALRVYEWCDELTRAGELFFLCSTDSAGMTYIRAVPAAQIVRVETADNDIQQETVCVQRLPGLSGEEKAWPVYDPTTDQRGVDGSFPAVMCHFAINRPVGAVRGESDLAPLLKWLSRYTVWLEDRARLNHYRNAFYFVVSSPFVSEAERAARQAVLNQAPPTPGSILVTDKSETWEVVHPRLDSQDAAEDGLALKKMIAAGAGLPLHFLAEPEGSTRTTAEAAGGPTFRHFEQRQLFFCEVLRQLCQLAVRRRAALQRGINTQAEILVDGADLSARDNAALAIATQAAGNTFLALYERGLIPAEEALRLVYRFAGEGGSFAGSNDPRRDRPCVDPNGRGGSYQGRHKAYPDNPDNNPDKISNKIINPEDGEPRGAAAI